MKNMYIKKDLIIKISMIVSMLIATLMVFATIIEKMYSIEVARFFIYDSYIFISLFIILIFLFFSIYGIRNILTYKKINIFVIHISFIIMFIGNLCTKYFSVDGIVFLRFNVLNNYFLSNNTYLKLNLYRKNKIFMYEIPICIENYMYNNKNIRLLCNNYIFNIKIIKYANNLLKKYVFDINGEDIFMCNIIINNISHKLLIKNGSYEVINNNIISYNLEYGDIRIIKNKLSNYYILINKNNRKTYFRIKKNSKIYINNLLFIFNEVLSNKGRIMFNYSFNKNTNDLYNNLIICKINIDGINKLVTFYGGKYNIYMTKYMKIGNSYVSIGYGSKIYKLPFIMSLKRITYKKFNYIDDIESFTSYINILYNRNKFIYKIINNNVIYFLMYKLFQNGLHKDYNGVNIIITYDFLGTVITYLSYILLFMGIFISFLNKFSRFRYLIKILFKIQSIKLMVISLFVFKNIFPDIIFAEESLEKCNYYYLFNKEINNKFGGILVKDYNDRIQPIDTLSINLLNTININNSLFRKYPNILTLMLLKYPYIFYNVPIFKIGKELKKKIICFNKKEYISLSDLLFINKDKKIDFILKGCYLNLLNKDKRKYDSFDNDIISIFKSSDVLLNILNKNYFKIFPSCNGGKWLSYYEVENNLSNKYYYYPLYLLFNKLFYHKNINSVELSTINNIINYQYFYLNDKSIYNKILLEIIYNKLNIFNNITYFYFIFGFIITITSIFKIINKLCKNIFFCYIDFISFFIITVSIIFHLLGLIIRGYISNHVPWSNGYESIVFTSCILSIISFLTSIFYEKNNTILGLNSIFSSILLIISNNCSFINSNITNLPNILKSFWLVIHVFTIITGYGFLLSSSIIGLLVLSLLFINNFKSNSINFYALKLSIINEISMYFGLYLLILGTFLGSIWADQSWGSYWSWDPKETWIAITICIYTLILHIRLLKYVYENVLYYILYFNLLSFFSTIFIIITYFVVNYYLSGLHSYANDGSDINILYYIFIIILIFIIITIYFMFLISSIKKDKKIKIFLKKIKNIKL